MVLFLRELEDGSCKLSARSKTAYDVQELASRFGGGGHAKAAGATLAGPLEDARGSVVAAALAALEESGRGSPPDGRPPGPTALEPPVGRKA